LKTLFNFIFVLFTLIGSLSCDSTEPIDELKPGRRDYTWSIDTLSKIAYKNSYTELWGYDPQHVWIAGDSWDLDKNILRFDGTSWHLIPILNQPPAAWALYGIDANNIWAAGNSFWKYNGNRFEFYNKYSIQGFARILTNDIYGSDISHLFAVGGAEEDTTGNLHPFILQFKNNSWELIHVDSMRGVFVYVKYSDSDPNSLYLLLSEVNSGAPDYLRIFNYSNNRFTELHNNELNPSDTPWITVLNNEATIAWDKKIFQLANGKPKLLYDFSSTIKSHSPFWGRNIKDLFFEVEGGLGHYNGEDIKVLFPINKKFYIMNCLFFEKQVFILFYEYESFKFYVLRGKLN